MRFLLDTNVLIPLEDSSVFPPPGLFDFARLAQENGHQLVYHPASLEDIDEDRDEIRRKQTKNRFSRYIPLDNTTHCPWNTPETRRNDAADNDILYALECEAVHYLVTNDKGIHKKAALRRLQNRVFAVQAARDLLARLHEQVSIQLPNIQDVPLHSLIPFLEMAFFDSLRNDYVPFDNWFREKAKDGRRAWVYWDSPKKLGAVCIYARQENEDITKHGHILEGTSLKLCTFKVAPESQGRKVGELFLKAAFRYASDNKFEHIFIHGNAEKQSFLFDLLDDFGFKAHPHGYGSDVVYLKEQPVVPPSVSLSGFSNFDYLRAYFPHFRTGKEVKKYLVPIQPGYHDILFPDYPSRQSKLLNPEHTAGNAIKQAYLCHAHVKKIKSGDIVLFYRSKDEQVITSLGVVEHYEALESVEKIIDLVRRRTVYSMSEIKEMKKPLKVMLFRLVKHFTSPPSLSDVGITAPPQTIQEINDETFQRIIKSTI
jgi:GNAT superfamily N-acetyltransferase